MKISKITNTDLLLVDKDCFTGLDQEHMFLPNNLRSPVWSVEGKCFSICSAKSFQIVAILIKH